MAVKEGYKQTEVGVIPEDWDYASIGELFDFKNGLNKEKKFFGYGLPIINYNDVYLKTEIRAKDVLGKVSLTRNEIKLFEVKRGDVFFTRTSETPEEIGISSVLTEDIEDTIFSGFVLRARPRNKKLDLHYKKYCFSTKLVRKEIVSNCTYTTRALTNGTVLSKISISLPPLPEQKAIATALSDVDGLINSLSKLIEKKKNIKQGAMQELLTGKKRLDGFSGEWVEVKVSAFGEIITGSTPPTSNHEYWNGDIPWVTPTDIKDKKNIYKSERSITTKGLSVIRQLKGDSILVTCIASIGKNAILKIVGACNQQINAILPNDKYDPNFIFYMFENNKQYLLSKAGITATNIVSKNTFSEMLFVVPPTIEEQKAIANILSDMDTEIEKLQSRLDKYKAIKQGMMQELLTGRIRLLEGA